MNLEIDTLTVQLVLLCCALLLVHSVFIRKSTPLLHPIILGRQAEAAKVRQSNSSAVWTHHSASSGLLICRPDNAARTLRDLIEHGRDETKTRVQLLAARLQGLAGSSQLPKRMEILLSDPNDTFHLILATACVSGLIPVLLDSATSSRATENLNYLVTTSALHETAKSVIANSEIAVYLLQPAGITGAGDSAPSFDSLPEVELKPAEKTETSAPALQCFISESESLVNISHLNLTAAVYAIGLYYGSSPSTRLSSSDLVYSTYPPASPLGFALALTALYHGARLDFAKDEDRSDLVNVVAKRQPTMLFLTPDTAKSLYKQVNEKFANGTPFPNQVYAAKLWTLRQGAFDREHVVWDRFFLNRFRAEYKLASIRTISIFSDSSKTLMTQKEVDGLRIMLGAFVTNGLSHPIQPVPLTATNMRDFQFIPAQRTAYLMSTDEAHHMGPPSANVQVKVELDDENSRKAEGSLLASGPALAQLAPNSSGSQQSQFVKHSDGSEWFKTGFHVCIAPNGTLRVLVD